MSSSDRAALLQVLSKFHFTSSHRAAILGDSIIIGASVESGSLSATIARATRANEALVRSLLTIINASLWLPSDLLFSSAAINRDTIADDHVDQNNEGRSLAFAVVSDPPAFSGGELEVLENGNWHWEGKKLVVTSGTWKQHDISRFPITFDGTSPHRSKPFAGCVRFSVILFYHTFCDNLAQSQLDFLRDLGFRLKRRVNDPHIFISHFAGVAEYGIGEAIVSKAASVGRKVRLIKRDLRLTKDDLLQPEPFGQDYQLAVDGQLLGYHSAWSCGTFSRIRFTGPRTLPLPVRNRSFMLGLPTNTLEQQKEADAGTLGATRSADFCQAVVQATKRFDYQASATGENPADPKEDPLPSAFLLQQWVDIANDPTSSSATTALCRHGPAFDGNYYSKRLTFMGWLRHLSSLSGGCECPRDRRHGNYKTWDAARASGNYPRGLCDEYASLWLNHCFGDSNGKVQVLMGDPRYPPSMLSTSGRSSSSGEFVSTSDAKPTKPTPRYLQSSGSSREFVSTSDAKPTKPTHRYLQSSGPTKEFVSTSDVKPTSPTPRYLQSLTTAVGGDYPYSTLPTPMPAEFVSTSDEQPTQLATYNHLSRVGKWGNCLVKQRKSPLSSARAGADVRLRFQQQTKQARKDEEEKEYIGGMRDPLSALRLVPGWESVGARCAVAINKLQDSDEDVKLVGLRLGDSDFDGPSKAVLHRVKEAICAEFTLEEIAQPKPEFGLASAISATLFAGLLHRARDPDADTLHSWIVEGAPMGMDAEIPVNGIFPPSTKVLPKSSRAPPLDIVWNESFEQYGSVLDNIQDATAEYDRFVSNGFIVNLDSRSVEHRFPLGHLSHVGVVIKVKRDGTRKVRIIVDMTGSDANPRSRIPERPILPRPLDPAGDAIHIVRAGAPVELASADFSDAFCHIFVHPSELRNNLVARPSPSQSHRSGKRSRPEVGLLVRLGFGSCGGPLIWSRVAAALGRMAQSVLRPQQSGLRSRLRIYLDDPIFILTGDAQRRRRDLAMVLLLWAAAGFSLSWNRVSLGLSASWIGIDYVVDELEGTVTVKIPEKAVTEALELASKLLETPMSSVRLLRRLAGKGSWIFSVAPRTRWTIQRLWATVSYALAQGCTSAKKGRKSGARHGLFARKQVELPLRWILAYWSLPTSPLKRVLRSYVPPPSLELVIDACPWGLGGYLVALSTQQVLEFFADPLSAEDLSRFNMEVGNAAGQQIWECLAILVALKLWSKHFQSGRAQLQIRGDSVVSLQLATKLSSPSPLLNALGAELALQLETFDIHEVYTQHTPGRLLVLADYLSRLYAPGADKTLPADLSGAKERKAPVRNSNFYKVWCVSHVKPSSPSGGG